MPYSNSGVPLEIDRAEIARLKDIASGEPESVREATVNTDGFWDADLPMHTDDVLLVELASV